MAWQDAELGAQYVTLNQLLGEYLRRELDRRRFAVEQRPRMSRRTILSRDLVVGPMAQSEGSIQAPLVNGR